MTPIPPPPPVSAEVGQRVLCLCVTAVFIMQSIFTCFADFLCLVNINQKRCTSPSDVYCNEEFQCYFVIRLHKSLDIVCCQFSH